MPWNKTLLKKAKLYLILDTEVAGYDKLFEILKQSADAGVDVFQLRNKKGNRQNSTAFIQKALAYLDGKALFIINDSVEITRTVKAAGVHLGQDDVPVQTARELLEAEYLIGASCQTLEQAIKAEKEGADYIGFGSVFKTLTKPEREPMDQDLLKKVYKHIKIPVFAIGGITENNVGDLAELGVKRVAVCRDICLSPDIGKTVRAFKKILEG